MHLKDIIPSPKKRKPVYQVFAALGLALTGIQVGFASIPDLAQPDWLSISLAVYTFLAGAGFTAAQAKVDIPSVSIEGTDGLDSQGRHAA